MRASAKGARSHAMPPCVRCCADDLATPTHAAEARSSRTGTASLQADTTSGRAVAAAVARSGPSVLRAPETSPTTSGLCDIRRRGTGVREDTFYFSFGGSKNSVLSETSYAFAMATRVATVALPTPRSIR